MEEVIFLDLVSSSGSKFESVYERNVDSVYKVCFMYLKNKHDAEDLVQSTFLKYLKKMPEFENVKHEKAWFITVASNTCKNHFKTWWNKNTVLSFEKEEGVYDKDSYVLNCILDLPVKYKKIVYMFYYSGFTTKEISTIINKNESTIRSDLSKARCLLKEKIGSEL